MRQTSSNADITYPPEMLPRASEDEEVEIVICCGGDACSQGRPCGRLVAFKPNERHSAC